MNHDWALYSDLGQQIKPANSYDLIINSRVWRAMTVSSSVGMTHTATRLSGVLMQLPFGPGCITGSKEMPSQASLAHTDARTADAWLPIPPVKTIPSTPPRLAAMPPASLAMRKVNKSMASAAAGSCESPSDRISDAIPDTPFNPDWWYSRSVTSARLRPSSRARTRPGSIAPLLVPIIRPSSGVSPIVVSILMPFRNAHRLAPLPRCATITRDNFGAKACKQPAMYS